MYFLNRFFISNLSGNNKIIIMKNITLLFFFIGFHFYANSQTIDLIGFYNVNGTMAIASLDGYMIISNGSIVDISDPANPVLNSSYGPAYLEALSILVDDGYVYFGTAMAGDLYIADISNIDFPLHEGYIAFGQDIGVGVYGIAKNDSVLFVVLNYSFCSIDITEKTNPFMLDTLFIEGGSMDVKVQGMYAFVASSLGLTTVDISSPENLQDLNHIGSGYISIDINETYAFLGKGSGGFDVFDITDPLNPSPAFSIPNSEGSCWDIIYRNNHIYIAAEFGGLFVYKLENNTATEMANYNSPGGGQNFSVCLQDSLILLPEYITGVAILQYDSTGTVGINNNTDLKNSFKLSPNPVRDYIHLKRINPANSNSDVRVKIYNSHGTIEDQFIFNGSGYKYDITGYSPGLYYCKISEDGKLAESIKFVVY